MAFTLETKDIKLTSANLGVDLQEQRYTVIYQVRSDISTNLVLATQWFAVNVPWDLTAFGDPYAFIEPYTVVPTDDANNDPRIFDCTATYSHRSASLSNEATSIEFDSNSYEIAPFKFLNTEDKEVAILNSAGDRFDDPVIETEKRQVIIITKTYSPLTTTPEGMARFDNSVNENPVTIADISIPARNGLILSVKPVIRPLSRVAFDWRITITIEVKDRGETYDRKILDQGFYYLELTEETSIGTATDLIEKEVEILGKSQTRIYRRIKATTLNPESGETEPVSEPILLDGLGGKLTNTTPGNEKYITGQTKTKQPWEEMDLPRHVVETI